MKKTILKATAFFTIMATSISFAQGTGVTQSTDNMPIGIQNNYESRGSGPSVLVAGSPGNAAWIDDVEAKLDGTGLVSADTFLTGAGTPTLAELQGYDAVLVFTDAGVADPTGFGDNLALYIEAGGAVVDATFTPNVSITGGFTAYELYSAAGQSNGANLGIGTINDPGSFILNGVTNFDGGTASFHNTAGIVAPGASVVAEYTTGAEFIITAENVGPANARRVFLNFYPPSFDARDDFWLPSSDGALIMANALLWASFNDAPYSVLVAGSPGDPAWLDDVQAKISATGSFSVNTFLTSAATPTLTQLQSYDAVFVFTDAGAADPAALGNVLGQYMDAGGPVVDATFTPNVAITGGFIPYELYSGAGQVSGAVGTLGTILVPGDPILGGVGSFNGGTASFHNSGGVLGAGATVVAEWDDGEPLIIRNENMGPSNIRRAFLNFYPPSIDARADFWDTTSDGDQIMRNAIAWVIDGAILSTSDNEIELNVALYPNPAQDRITFSNPNGLSIDSGEIIDVMGRIVQNISIGESTSKTIQIGSLTSGVYFFRVRSGATTNVIKFIKR